MPENGENSYSFSNVINYVDLIANQHGSCKALFCFSIGYNRMSEERWAFNFKCVLDTKK